MRDPRFWISGVVGLAIPMGMAAMNVAVAVLTLGALVLGGTARRQVLAHSSMHNLGFAWLVYLAILVVSALANGIDMAALRVLRGQLLFVLCVPAYVFWCSGAARWGLVWGLGVSWFTMLTYTIFQIYAPKLLPLVLHRAHDLHAAAFENALTWTAVIYIAGMMLGAVLRHRRRAVLANLVISAAVIVVVLVAERTYAVLAVALWLVSLVGLPWRRAVKLAALGFVAGALVWTVLSPDQKQRYNPGAVWASHTVEVRRDLWMRATDMVATSPWLGVGPGNYGPELRRVQGGSSPYHYSHAHSNLFHALAETGLAGLVALLLFQIRWLRLGLQQIKTAPELICVTLFIVLGGLTEANWIDSEVVILSAMMTGLVLALEDPVL